jgi:hypothetical protein
LVHGLLTDKEPADCHQTRPCPAGNGGSDSWGATSQSTSESSKSRESSGSPKKNQHPTPTASTTPGIRRIFKGCSWAGCPNDHVLSSHRELSQFAQWLPERAVVETDVTVEEKDTGEIVTKSVKKAQHFKSFEQWATAATRYMIHTYSDSPIHMVEYARYISIIAETSLEHGWAVAWNYDCLHRAAMLSGEISGWSRDTALWLRAVSKPKKNQHPTPTTPGTFHNFKTKGCSWVGCPHDHVCPTHGKQDKKNKTCPECAVSSSAANT